MARRREALSPYDKILIVCEGAKTERHYFGELARFYDINSHNIKIVGGGGSPARIVKMAEAEYEAGKRVRIPFDKVYCVFDKNSHADYGRALAQIANKENFEAIVSVPCFEYWLLLHFRNTDQPYSKTGNKSACDQVIDELRKFLDGYNKGDRNIFSMVQAKTQIAQQRAEKLCRDARNRNYNPHTNVHELVEHLQNITRLPRR